MKQPATHLVVERGPNKGQAVNVPLDGARLGRSSKNDICLLDPLLSRHHCRFFFKPDGALWVADLGSANQTLVNDHPVQETPLRVGDRVLVGDTTLKVVNDGKSSVPAPAPDLGLTKAKTDGVQKRPMKPGLLILLIALPVLLLIFIFMFPAALSFLGKLTEPPPEPAGPAQPVATTPTSLEIEYEKVEATPANIFRYHLTVDSNRRMTIQIDDIAHDRHVRKDKILPREYIQNLALSLTGHGFSTLSPSYQGIQPNTLDQHDLSITIDRQTHRVRVVNRVEPPIFKTVREIIEEAGKSQLGLWAIQFSPEKLIEMARDAALVGRKLYDEREIEYGNLFEAIKSFTEAEWYLETVEPKPDYYPDIVTGLSTCREELEQQYKDHHFRAQKAIRLSDWPEARRELQIIRQMVPNREDPRNREAERMLIEVERHVTRGD